MVPRWRCHDVVRRRRIFHPDALRFARLEPPPTGRPVTATAAAAIATGLGRPASLDLGLIGNCTIGALVDRAGAVVWCCMPRFDGDPVFHALLDSADGLPREGSMSVELEGLARVEQAYEPGTAILRTSLFDASGQGIEIGRASCRERVFVGV